MMKVLLLTLSLSAVYLVSEAMTTGPVQSEYTGLYADEVLKMRVNAHRVECQPGAASWCYSVQKGATIGMDTWETLPQPIEGFSFEEGYIYDLIVRVDIQHDKTGPERFKYVLVEIISKIKAS